LTIVGIAQNQIVKMNKRFKSPSQLLAFAALCALPFLPATPSASGGILVDTIFSFLPSAPTVEFEGLAQAADGSFYGLSSNPSLIFKITPQGSLSILSSFFSVNGEGGEAQPVGSLVQGQDGAFYGTTVFGGANGSGSVFKMTSERTITILYSFNAVTDANGNNLDGECPRAGLTLGRDGSFYGTTSTGGSNAAGTIFKITSAGALTTLYAFGTLIDTNGSPIDGFEPATALLEGSDGDFYGTTEFGGIGNGTIFKISPSGDFALLYQFPAAPPNVYLPENSDPSALIEGANGLFYGTTTYGGSNYLGSVFEITANGTFTTLHSFRSALDGEYPLSGLAAGGDGYFYGTTSSGGPGGKGTIFRISRLGHFATLSSFNGSNGSAPGNLTRSKDGAFYGTTERGGFFTMSSAGAVKMLFQGIGTMPEGGLIQGRDGNLYGMTIEGGTVGAGTVFAVNPRGGLRTLCSFDGSDGVSQLIVTSAGLVEGSDGNFYGTTPIGGINEQGTVFRVTPSGELTTLVKFDTTNGSFPEGTLVADGGEDFYGITFSGGRWLAGTFFKMSRSGHLTTLFEFDGTNASGPSSLWRAPDGDFYGTTWGGGNGNGTIFKINRLGQFTVLAEFNGLDGAMPTGLVMGCDSFLVGAAGAGGTNGYGTLVTVGRAGGLRPFAFFDGENGAGPNPPIMARDGNYYGTTFGGGPDRNGALYQVTPSGKPTTLSAVGGAGRLIEGTDGAFYGTALYGGSYGFGSVFRLAPARYAGLFYDTNNIDFQTSGAFQVTVGLSLYFSGALTIGGQSFSISGQLDSNFLSSLIIHRPRLSDLAVSLQFSETNDAVCGTVTDGDWTAQLHGVKPGLYNAANPAPEAGRYAITFLPDSVDAANRDGASTGQVAVSANGTISLAGTLSDHTVIGQTSAISSCGQWPLFVSLYGGKGSLLGWITFSNSTASQFRGTVSWIRSGANGFTNVMSALGCFNNATP